MCAGDRTVLLIIDDEEDILDILVEQIGLFDLGIDLLVASKVEEVERLIAGADLILSDINMPQKERLEQLLQNAQLPVARLTGHHDLAAGLVLKKPFKIEELKNLLIELMRLKK